MSERTPEPGLSHDEARAIAKQLAQAVHARPDDPAHDPLAPRKELPPADEDRIEAALVELGAADPEDTTAAEREGA